MRAKLALIALLFSGCYCWTTPHQTEPKCVIAHAAVTCTVDAIGAAILKLGPSLLGMLSGTVPFDWGAIESAAEQMGLKDGGCLIAALSGLLSGASMPRAAEGGGAALAKLKAHFGVPEVVFKVGK